MRLHLHTFDLPLRHTFTISRSSTDVEPTLIVELQDGELSGYGEATQNRHYETTVQSMTESIEKVRPQIESYELDDPVEFWHHLAPSLSHDPFAQCALDQAAHDLWGKRRGQPVYRLWGLDAVEGETPVTSYTIGIDSIDTMVSKLLEMPDWPIYKIKLGTAEDLEIIRQLRAQTDSVFRVDANCGWGVDETIENSHELKRLNVEFIEQPMPREDWEGMKRVYAESALPVIADESCISEADVSRCADCFHGVNVKLVKCGGLTPARRMIAEAQQLGLRTMVGCMTESTVGVSSIAQLLPLLDYVDMDGPLLLSRDIATGVSITAGRVTYANEAGCGVCLHGFQDA